MTVRFFFTLGWPLRRTIPPKKHPSSCTTFSLYVRLSMNSFYCYTPNPHCLTRPCFPKASAKVDTFTVNTKYYGHFFQAETLANLRKLPQTSKEYAVKHIFNTRNHPRFKGKLFSKWKTKERKGAEKRGRITPKWRRKRRKRRWGDRGGKNKKGGRAETAGTRKKNKEGAQVKRNARRRRKGVRQNDKE